MQEPSSLAPENVEPVAVRRPATVRPTAPANILLVDDQPANLLALECLLEELGQNLVKASSGEEALDWLIDHDCAVILLDVKMIGLDGFETAQLVRRREKTRRTPIIFMTAYETTELRERKAYALGAVDYLTKPLVPEILRAKVQGFVELFQKTEEVKQQAEKLRQMEREEYERRLAEEKLRQTEERYREIRKLNAELEDRVQLRTSELEEANRSLAREVSVRQRALAELERSNLDLEQFAYSASHDMKDPLRKIRIYLQLLERRYRGRLGADADQYIAFAVQAAGRMQSLVSDLLTYARVGSPADSREPTDCAAVLQQALANLQAMIQERRAVVTQGPLPVIHANATQLVRLFENLLSNAIKFNKSSQPAVHVEARQEDGRWLFAVRDNGIGIEPRYAERIFTLFERLHAQEAYPGTGIGLAICKKIVERHGGRIWVESEAGQGATFFFTILSAPGG
jgi:signal transduction histidine kinase